MKGEYDGESLTVEGILLEEDFILEGGSILDGDESTGFLAWLFWLCGRVLQTLSIIARGIGLLGVLGTGARISIWYPGARKLS